ncbi:hypothetical protein DL764_001640 [Monosporascus ibericus]|uniref:Uncharacterized protein n=1 Tax=Monosporascus ibericus TaxID=155417 RepID=A0A4Q4TTM3_9PEZI|nr:hypothetical protein DL764_001640 [Monosporascus ibericus]
MTRSMPLPRGVSKLLRESPLVRLTAAAADRPTLRRPVSTRGGSPNTYRPSDNPNATTDSGPAPPSSDRGKEARSRGNKKLFAPPADDMIRRQLRAAWVEDAAVHDSSPLANLIFSDRGLSD